MEKQITRRDSCVEVMERMNKIYRTVVVAKWSLLATDSAKVKVVANIFKKCIFYICDCRC